MQRAKIVSCPPPRRVRYEELRKHAQFPKARTTIRKETVTVPAGTFDCTVYVVQGDGHKEDEATTYCVAKNLLGAPVLFHQLEKKYASFFP